MAHVFMCGQLNVCVFTCAKRPVAVQWGAIMGVCLCIPVHSVHVKPMCAGVSSESVRVDKCALLHVCHVELCVHVCAKVYTWCVTVSQVQRL